MRGAAIRPKARAKYHATMRRFIELRREQNAEKEKLNIPSLEAEL